jgi:hypothetical protein
MASAVIGIPFCVPLSKHKDFAAPGTLLGVVKRPVAYVVSILL